MTVSATDSLRPVLIDPEGIYTDGQIRLMLDLTEATMARARREGGLRYTRQNKRVLYRGQWITDWLESSADTTIAREQGVCRG